MKNCLHCLERQALPNEVLCSVCVYLPRCEICTVFLDGIVRPSEENALRCDDCLDFENRIKLNCIFCKEQIPLYMDKRSRILRFLIRGNNCGKCNREHEEKARRAHGRGRKPKYEGYLALMHRQYQAGSISKDCWEDLQALNPHGVNYSEAKK